MIPTRIAGILAVAIFGFASIGCQVAGPPPEPQTNPFADPGLDRVPPQPPAYPASPAVCPDGNCPNCPSYGQEVYAKDNRAALVNQTAALEQKNQTGSCPTGNCPYVQRPRPAPVAQPTRPAPTYRVSGTSGHPATVWPQSIPPIRLNPGETLLRVGPLRPSTQPSAVPQAMPHPDRRPASQPAAVGEQSREGAFACQRCGRRAVGDQWQELWADDDTPLTCLCKACWYRITPAERTAELERYARRSRGTLNPVVKAAIREASRK